MEAARSSETLVSYVTTWCQNPKDHDLKGPKVPYLLTYSMVQDIIWKADGHSACQKTSCLLIESLPCSQKPATGPYPEPAESSSPIDPYLPNDQLNIILPLTPRSSQWSHTFGPPNQNP
jgi:hypothetical protein